MRFWPRRRSTCFVCLDHFGDLMLRQRLFVAALDEGDRVCVVVRHPYDELLPYIDVRIEPILVAHDPWHTDDASRYAARIEKIATQIDTLRPGTVVFPAFGATVTDYALAALLSHHHRVGFHFGVKPQAPGPEFSDVVGTILKLPHALLLDVDVQVHAECHEIEKYQRLLANWLGDKVVELAQTPSLSEFWQPRICLPPNAIALARKVRESIGIDTAYAVLCPFGASSTPLKVVPMELALEAAHYLSTEGLQLLLVGTMAECAALSQLQAELAVAYDTPATLWIGRPGELGVLMGLLAGATLYFGNDNGATHFAAALNCPLVTVFGGGHGRQFFPQARSSVTVVEAIACSGCEWQCAYSEPHCLTHIAPNSVVAAIARMLNDEICGNEIECLEGWKPAVD